ncbi:putative F-box protein At1g55070 [Papaver somniferum]|uniref:putative F-box protein At1g55070 n=1 Tax=Papaver somniferum TaxID=3469 RepID=UPI000E6FBA90|nr:putative F-box protein At1g55070 [Papaver somniferum]
MGRINNLPKEIMLEILTRLRAESVLKCKLVCKPWRHLVRLRSFSQMHLNHLNSDSGKLSFIITNYESVRPKFYYSEYEEDFHETPPISRLTRMELNLPFDGYSLTGSDNGLICFNSCHGDSYGTAYIYNPITREYIILPRFKGNY